MFSFEGFHVLIKAWQVLLRFGKHFKSLLKGLAQINLFLKSHYGIFLGLWFFFDTVNSVKLQKWYKVLSNNFGTFEDVLFSRIKTPTISQSISPTHWIIPETHFGHPLNIQVNLTEPFPNRISPFFS